MTRGPICGLLSQSPLRIAMIPRLLPLLAAGLLLGVPTDSARSEIVERELGTDAEGRPVMGHVFQGGRDFHRSRRDSGLPVRRVVRLARPVDRHPAVHYGDAWWYVPVIPLHCGGHGSFGGLSLWHGWGDRVSITVIR